MYLVDIQKVFCFPEFNNRTVVNKKYDAMYGCPYQALGELYSKLDQPKESVNYFSKMADAETNSPDSQFYTAWKYFTQGEFEKALKYIKRAKKENTSNAKAAIYVLSEKTILLIQWFGGYGSTEKDSNVIADAPITDPNEEFKAALEAYEKENILAASEHINRALSKKNTPEYKVIKGFVLLSIQDYESAQILFKEVMNSEHAHLGAQVGLGHLNIIRKNNSQARMLLEAVLKSAIPVEEKKVSQSIQYRFDRLVYEMACLGLGWLHANQSLHEKAITYYDLILDNRPDHLLALIGKGNSLSGVHRLDDAEIVLQKALDLYPGNKYAITELGIIHYNRGQYEKAEKSLREALSKDAETYTCPYEGLGLVYLKKGDSDKAKEFFSKAIKINPNIEYKKYNGLAKIYIREGNIQKAKELLNKSVENFPYDEEARELLKTLNASSPATNH